LYSKEELDDFPSANGGRKSKASLNTILADEPDVIIVESEE
jgi:hypothetical protein